MSSETNITATQMMWQPKLLRLTYPARPDIENGTPTYCYVRADLIAIISRSWMEAVKVGNKDQMWPGVVCTTIGLQSGQYLFVAEQPEAVAAMRDRALGFEPTLKEVSSQ